MKLRPAVLRYLLAGVFVWGAACASAQAQDDQTPPEAQEVPDAAQEVSGEDVPDLLDSRVTTTPERARLVIDLAAPTEFTVYTLDNPRRAVVELRAQDASEDGAGSPSGDGLVEAYNLTTISPDRVRFEMTLLLPAQVQQSYVLEAFDDQPARLVIDLVPDTAENFAENARQQQEEQGPTPQADADEDLAELDSQQMAPGETATSRGDTRPLIVIDPGHGGVDGGAQAANGLEEKDIVLAFGLKLQSLLVETGRFDVALTRDTDTFLTLSQRLELTRLNRADLFISLHADSFDQEDVRGASIYTRGDLATSEIDRVLAENENKVDLIAGFEPPEEEQVVDVLVDLLTRETRRQSYIAGHALIEQLEPSIQLRRFPLRQADFFVLNAPDVPSVLIELGFLSNSDDTENLTTDAWLDRVAAALARGVAVYFESET